MKTEPRLKIAIPKQDKMKAPALSYLSIRGFNLLNDDGETAILSGRKWSIPNISVEFIRASDALLLLQEKVVDLAIIGSDVVDEKTSGLNPQLQKPYTKLDLEIAQCGFQIAVSNIIKEKIKTPSDLNGLRIITSYPNLLQAWLTKNGVTPSKIITREGGGESSIRQGIADVVADLVDTGGTLRKNNLTAVFDVTRTSAKIYSPQSSNFMSELLANEFLRYLRLPIDDMPSISALKAA